MRGMTAIGTRWRQSMAAGVLAVCVSMAGNAAQAADSPADQTTTATGMTLKDALQQALSPGNPTLEQQTDNVDAAAGRVQEARGAFDWNTHVEGGWQELFVPKPVNGLLTNQTSIVSSYYYNASIGRRFRNGLEVAPGITAYPGAGATPAQTAGLTQLRPALGLKVPLLRGLGSVADAPERSALDSLAGAKESRAFAVQQFAEQVAASFWKCLAQDQILAETRSVDQHASDYTATLNDLVKKGLLEPTIAQQWTANAVAQHLDVARAEDASTRCRRDLSYLITGLPAAPQLRPTGSLPNVDTLALAVEQIDEEALVDAAVDQRHDLVAASRAVMAARENLRAARDNERPELDLRVDPDHAILSFNKALGNNAAKGRTAQASAAEDQAEVAMRQLDEQVRDQVDDAVVDLKRAAADWTALDRAEKQMEAVVGDSERRARYGSIAWSDFLNAQNQLSQLREQMINARLNFAIALANLNLATGAIATEEPSRAVTDLTSLPKPRS
jgi:outer membrane protein TolC